MPTCQLNFHAISHYLFVIYYALDLYCSVCYFQNYKKGSPNAYRFNSSSFLLYFLHFTVKKKIFS